MEQPPFVTDTAEGIDVNKESVTKNVRNELLDCIVKSGIECYTALLIDIVIDPANHLFCGQVGKIENVILDKEDQDCYLLTFIDYKKGQNEFAQCLVKKETLLPLFCFDPETYEKYKKPEQETSINELRNRWQSCKFEVTSKLELARHKKSENQFQVGQLVTIEVDFEQKTNNESFFIQAGQIGILSKVFRNTDSVEVTFWSIPFGLLALTRKDFLSSSRNLLPKHNPLRYATSSWERKIRICKDYLFPLYVENLR